MTQSQVARAQVAQAQVAQAQVALVTGAGSGVGAATAKKLARNGFEVILVGRRSEPLELTRKLIAAESPQRTAAMQADISDEDAVVELFSKVKTEFGRLDLLFNNAGIRLPSKSVEEVTFAEWNNALASNLTGAFLCTREAVRLMTEQSPSGGRIINNGSLSAHVPRLYSAPYTATKHAISGLTKSTALDGRGKNIACGQIDIGNAATDMTERMDTGALQADGTMAVEPRIAVDLVADAVAFMAGLPLSVNIPTLTIMATEMPYVGRG